MQINLESAWVTNRDNIQKTLDAKPKVDNSKYTLEVKVAKSKSPEVDTATAEEPKAPTKAKAPK